jgi:hypothetical protein
MKKFAVGARSTTRVKAHCKLTFRYQSEKVFEGMVKALSQVPDYGQSFY